MSHEMPEFINSHEKKPEHLNRIDINEIIDEEGSEITQRATEIFDRCYDPVKSKKSLDDAIELSVASIADFLMEIHRIHSEERLMMKDALLTFITVFLTQLQENEMEKVKKGQ